MTDTLVAPSQQRSADVVPQLHRVVLLDTRPERRALMRLILEQCVSLVVVGTAASIEEAEAEMRDGFADVVVLEIQMPIPKGLATIESLHERFPLLHLVVCTFHDDPETIKAATEAGAVGYLIKPVSARDINRFMDTLAMPPAPPFVQPGAAAAGDVDPAGPAAGSPGDSAPSD